MPSPSPVSSHMIDTFTIPAMIDNRFARGSDKSFSQAAIVDFLDAKPARHLGLRHSGGFARACQTIPECCRIRSEPVFFIIHRGLQICFSYRLIVISGAPYDRRIEHTNRGRP